jgi:hypothetical protein
MPQALPSCESSAEHEPSYGRARRSSSTGQVLRCAARSQARSPCAAPASGRRNTRRCSCRSKPRSAPWCSPIGAPIRCWSGESSRLIADAAWASAPSPPRSHPTSGCARRLGVGPATGLTTAGSLRARTFSHARNLSASTGSPSERLTSPLTVRIDLGKRSSAQRWAGPYSRGGSQGYSARV